MAQEKDKQTLFQEISLIQLSKTSLNYEKPSANLPKYILTNFSIFVSLLGTDNTNIINMTGLRNHRCMG